jgi:hypothetical protein
MADMLELSMQYRISGLACKSKLSQLKTELGKENLPMSEELLLRREITLLTAMARECIETSLYLQHYFERRQRLERSREASRT